MTDTSKLTMTRPERMATHRKGHFERGQAVVLFGLMLTVLIGIVAVAVDGGNLYLLRRQMQSAADLAALAGAQRLYLGSNADAIADARSYATLNGFPNATINVPPTSGIHKNEVRFVEVLINKSTPTFFAGVLGISQVTVSARAVARTGYQLAPYAMLALSTSESPAIDFGGSNVVQIKGAGIMSNSGMSPSIKQATSSGMVNSDGPVNAVGTIVGNFVAPSVRSGVPLYPDPLSRMPAPSYGAPGTDAPITRSAAATKPQTLLVPASGGPLPPGVSSCGDVYTFCPGVYWGGVQISGGSYTMAPGIYVFAGGGFSMTGGSISGNGIFIYNTNDPKPGGGNYGGATGDFGPINFNTNQPVDLKASHVPLYTGMASNVLIFQDRNSTDSGDAMGIQAVGNTNLYGTVYIPNNGINIAGGGSSGVAHGQIIADTIGFTGGSAAGVEYDPDWAVVTPGASLAE